MRIGIDAAALLLRSAGVKNYLYHWVLHLRRQAGPHRITAFPFLGELGRLDHQRSTLGAWRTAPRLAWLYFVNLPGNPALDLFSARCDVFHHSNQLRRRVRRAKATATLHDLTALILPEAHTPGNIRADQDFFQEVAAHADGLIAVSESTRQDAIRMLGLPPEKIETIHPGVAEPFFRAAPAARAGARPYVLFVGTLEPRKNVDALLDAWENLRPSLREEFELVVAGPPGWGSEHTLRRLESGARAVRYLGYVPESDLPALTASATVIAYPSLYEGFGFPVAQAMAAGVPVITSNVAALPEVAGDAALLVDPRSRGEIRDALEKLLLSPSLRAQLSGNGRRRAEQFRWERCAEQSLRFFERVVGPA